MLLLALDTATEKGSLALMAGDQVLMEYSLESPNAYLTCLMPAVAAILRNTGKEVTELTAVAVSAGPGNFTGLRIGLATAKTLAWSLHCPLVPVPTLEVLAAQVPFQPDPVGRGHGRQARGSLLGAVPVLGRSAPGGWKARCACRWLTFRPGCPCRCGSPAPASTPTASVLTKLLPPEIAWAPPELRLPGPSTLARLARRRLEEGLTANPAQLVPTYLRPAL